MGSIVIELQKDALDKNNSVTHLLRKAMVVAKKLDVKELMDWISNELNGYDDVEKLPRYRNVNGQVMVHNPYHGWQPVMFQARKTAEIFERKKISSPISEIENLLQKSTGESTMTYSLPDGLARSIMKSTMGMVPYFLPNESQMNGIIESVKNIVLDWSLKLEAKGIMGENLSFSSNEKGKASSVTYHIENFSGIIGDISSSHFQIGDYNSIHSELKKLGVSQEDRNELEKIMDSYKESKVADKKALMSKGMDWLRRNGPTIGTVSDTIRKWFETASQ